MLPWNSTPHNYTRYHIKANPMKQRDTPTAIHRPTGPTEHIQHAVKASNDLSTLVSAHHAFSTPQKLNNFTKRLSTIPLHPGNSLPSTTLSCQDPEHVSPSISSSLHSHFACMLSTSSPLQLEAISQTQDNSFSHTAHQIQIGRQQNALRRCHAHIT